MKVREEFTITKKAPTEESSSMRGAFSVIVKSSRTFVWSSYKRPLLTCEGSEDGPGHLLPRAAHEVLLRVLETPRAGPGDVDQALPRAHGRGHLSVT